MLDWLKKPEVDWFEPLAFRRPEYGHDVRLGWAQVFVLLVLLGIETTWIISKRPVFDFATVAMVGAAWALTIPLVLFASWLAIVPVRLSQDSLVTLRISTRRFTVGRLVKVRLESVRYLQFEEAGDGREAMVLLGSDGQTLVRVGVDSPSTKAKVIAFFDEIGLAWLGAESEGGPARD